MNVDEVAKTLSAFVKRHQTTFANLGSRQTQILELAAVIGVSQHYAASGFEIDVENPNGVAEFVVKSGTRGHPAEYSRIVCYKDQDVVELHTNLVVRGAHDEGIYCVDVGIVTFGSVPRKRGKDKWICLENPELKSFAEVKKLVVYPMLLAQFLGIVHEIRPDFLEQPSPTGFGPGEHLPPTLISLGHFSGNSRHIADSFVKRGFGLLITVNFDMHLAWSRRDPTRSPFFGVPMDLEAIADD